MKFIQNGIVYFIFYYFSNDHRQWDYFVGIKDDFFFFNKFSFTVLCSSKIKLYLFLNWVSKLFCFVFVFRIILRTRLLVEVNTWMPIGIYIYLCYFFLCLLKKLYYLVGMIYLVFDIKPWETFSRIAMSISSKFYRHKVMFLFDRFPL